MPHYGSCNWAGWCLPQGQASMPARVVRGGLPRSGRLPCLPEWRGVVTSLVGAGLRPARRLRSFRVLGARPPACPTGKVVWGIVGAMACLAHCFVLHSHPCLQIAPRAVLCTGQLATLPVGRMVGGGRVTPNPKPATRNAGLAGQLATSPNLVCYTSVRGGLSPK